jgi:hypothetical protein
MKTAVFMFTGMRSVFWLKAVTGNKNTRASESRIYFKKIEKKIN